MCVHLAKYTKSLPQDWALAACHIILLACSSTQCCQKLEKTVVTGLVMVITLGELLFWLASKARCSQKVFVIHLSHIRLKSSHQNPYILCSLGWSRHYTYTCMVSTFWLCCSHFLVSPLSMSWSVHWFVSRGQNLNEKTALSKLAFSSSILTQEFRGDLETGNIKSTLLFWIFSLFKL